jgi:hypothetical protein
MYHRVNVDSTINMTSEAPPRWSQHLWPALCAGGDVSTEEHVAHNHAFEAVKPPRDRRWISATDASAILGISRATLYAYVSRGLIRSEATESGVRQRRYAREDVERLRQRRDERRDPNKAAARALQWGMPVLESSITLNNRGHAAVPLPTTRSIAEGAALIWTGRLDPRPAAAAGGPPAADVDVRLPFASRAQVMLAAAAGRDAAAADLRVENVAARGWRILQVMQLPRLQSSISSHADGASPPARPICCEPPSSCVPTTS